MTVRELEEEYERLRDQLLNGELDEAGFRAAVEQLRFQDELGNSWKIGWYTGKWYRFDQAQWIQGTPTERSKRSKRRAAPRATGDSDRRPRLPFVPCLVIALVGLLLAASALLIFGWNSDWWRESGEEATAAAEATRAEELARVLSATPLPATATSMPPATTTPSRTPSPTATQRPSATPTLRTPTPAATSTSTSTPTSTPSAESTASVRPTSAPSLRGKIYFPVFDPSPERRTFDIHVVDLASGERGIMVGQASQPALSANGQRLAFRSWDPGNRGISVRELTEEKTWAWVGYHEAEHPSWSPDGQSVVFASQQESDRQWRLYHTWGMEIELLKREGADVFGRVPIWAPDGRIIYWECPLGSCGLYAMHSDGTGLTRLTSSEHDMAPAISPDRSQVAFMSDRDGNWDIYVVQAQEAGTEPQEPRRLAGSEARDGLPTWSPTGSWIAFVSERSGVWAVWAVRRDGSGIRKLFDVGGPLTGEVASVPASEQHGWTWESLAWGE